MTKKNEPRLKSIKPESLSKTDFLKFIFGRDSFYRDYKLLHASERGLVNHKLHHIFNFIEMDELYDECILCFQAAIEMDRPTYYFNCFIIDLIERYYSDLVYSNKKKEIKTEHLLVEDDPSFISYEWVLFSQTLNSYQRYLLFEYLALGYTLEALATRRYCTVRTIENHLNQIVDLLD